ncbi:hypothetical protein BDZ97DRAFT_781277 [Flammula alnicola]|nr:hypothetical protein BDZ97DRAFT_781277 [Flammula alnicola]
MRSFNCRSYIYTATLFFLLAACVLSAPSNSRSALTFNHKRHLLFSSVRPPSYGKDQSNSCLRVNALYTTNYSSKLNADNDSFLAYNHVSKPSSVNRTTADTSVSAITASRSTRTADVIATAKNFLSVMARRLRLNTAVLSGLFSRTPNSGRSEVGLGGELIPFSKPRYSSSCCSTPITLCRFGGKDGGGVGPDYERYFMGLVI